MNLSLEQMVRTLKDKNESIKGNLGFVLTVIRDNTTDDNTYKYLDMLIKRANEEGLLY